MSRPLVAEVIAIGDELTTGQRLDTNTKWLSERLTELGVEVRYHTTVGDRLDANIAVFRTAAERAGVVVTTGGLGPTADDLTRDAMAATAGVDLVEDAVSLEAIAERFRLTGRRMPPSNRRQAQFPAGATPIDNPGGTAPGVAMTIAACPFFALPGVPAEMRPMWHAGVAPAIERLTGGARATRHFLFRCFGAGESRIEELLGDLIDRGHEPLVGITASKATITLRVTASGANADECWRAMRGTNERIQATLGSLVFAAEPVAENHAEVTLQDYAIERLDQRGWTVAAVEGMTRGLLGHWLAEAEAGYRGDDQAPPIVGECRFSPTASGANVADLARGVAGEGCGVAIGEATADGNVPIAVATPAGLATKHVTLLGHESIHLDLVAKHALNLLRLELDKNQEPKT